MLRPCQTAPPRSWSTQKRPRASSSRRSRSSSSTSRRTVLISKPAPAISRQTVACCSRFLATSVVPVDAHVDVPGTSSTAVVIDCNAVRRKRESVRKTDLSLCCHKCREAGPEAGAEEEEEKGATNHASRLLALCSLQQTWPGFARHDKLVVCAGVLTRTTPKHTAAVMAGGVVDG